MGNFNDFLHENKNTDKGQSQESDYTDLERKINEYKKLSPNELMNQFLQLTLEKKKKGELNKGELLKIKELLSPMLDNSQNQYLNELLNMVENV